MSEAQEIRRYLDARGYTFIAGIHLDSATDTVLLKVPREKVRARAEHGFTSRRQLHFVAKAIGEKFDLQVAFAFQDTTHTADIEAGLRARLRREFQDLATGAFVSFPTSDRAAVWVEVSRIPEETEVTEMHELVVNYLGAFGVEVVSFDSISPALPEPSLPAILRSLKQLAPADILAIREELSRRGFRCPSEKWLSSRLDVARKRRLIQRDERGRFVLTAAGLNAVPSTRTRVSSDIDRILWLARHKEW